MSVTDAVRTGALTPADPSIEELWRQPRWRGNPGADGFRTTTPTCITVQLPALFVEEEVVLLGEARLVPLDPARVDHVGVLSLGVHPRAQRQGIGRALMEALIDHGRSARLLGLALYVRADNVPARSLYRSLGFEDEAIRERFVRLEDGTFVDDVIIRRFLG